MRAVWLLLLVGCPGAETNQHVENPPRVDAGALVLARDAGGGAVVSVACGDFHSCAITTNGTRDREVRCWGRNKSGELGDGTDVDRPRPVPVQGLSGVVELALGANYSCAIMGDRSVTCWGSGRLLGDAKIHDKLPPTKVPGVANVKELRAGGYMICALLEGGNVTCWGLDPRPHGEPREAGSIAVAGAHGCARVGDGARCWGEGIWSAAPPKDSFSDPRLSGVQQIATGDTFACALLESGKVACWGRNDEGALGQQPDSDNHSAALTVSGVEGASQVVAAESHVCAIERGGKVICWGGNDEGELGRGTRTIGEQAKPVPNLSARQLAIGADHVCAITLGDEVLCWGNNRSGQLGDGSTERRLEPVRVAF